MSGSGHAWASVPECPCTHKNHVTIATSETIYPRRSEDMDNCTSRALIELVERAEELGIGIALLPTPDGWRIAHCGVEWPAVVDYDIGVGGLADGYMLEDAARHALIPLEKLGASLVAARRAEASPGGV